MKRARVISGGLTSLILLSAVVSGGAWYARRAVSQSAREERRAEERVVATTKVVSRDFELSVSVTGKLAAVKSTPVMTEVQGKVIRVIPNGSRVNKDDIIVELDAPRMARQVRDFDSQYQAMVQQLAKRKKDLSDEVEKASLTLDESQQQLEQFKESQKVEMDTKQRQYDFDAQQLALLNDRYVRKQRQAKESLIPATELESADAEIKSKEFGLEKSAKNLELAKAQQASDLLEKQRAVQQAQSGLTRAKASQGDEVRSLEMRLQTTKQQLDRAKEQLSKATVRAPVAGLVVLSGGGGRRGGGELAAGDMVWERAPIATIPDLSQMRVTLELTQEQVRRVKRGQKARVVVATAPGQVFTGEVTEISQNAQDQQSGWMSTGERVFSVVVLVKDTKGAYLRPGTTAQATILIERLPKVLALPLECVFDREGKKVVYVPKGDTFVPVAVELGPENEDLAVVKKGLRPGDRVAMHDLKNLGLGTAGGAGEKSGSSF